MGFEQYVPQIKGTTEALFMVTKKREEINQAQKHK